jgi:exopolysaccharide production protein ExoZ
MANTTAPVTNIQVLRAVAALMVVHGHAAAELGLRFDGGATGVDLFFVISGFIIAYVASTDPRQFLTRRLIRIVPTYWVSTLVIFLLILAMPSMFRSASPDVGLLIRSLLFFPDGSKIHPDGLPHPTLSGGWTLNYEMYFYLVFAVALVVSKHRPSVVAIGLLVAVMAIVDVTGLHRNPVPRFYGNRIVLEFVFGMVAFHVVQHAESQPLRDEAASAQRVLLAFCIVAGLALLLFTKELFGEGDRWLLNGIPAFVIVGSAVMLERIHGWRVRSKSLVLIGDASYVLYLSHAYVVLGIARLCIGNRRFSEPVGQVVVLGLMAVAAGVAILFYTYGEKPLLAYLKRRLIVRSPRPSETR